MRLTFPVVFAAVIAASPAIAATPSKPKCGPAMAVLHILDNAGFKLTWSGKFGDDGNFLIGQTADGKWAAVSVSTVHDKRIACVLESGDAGKVAGEVI